MRPVILFACAFACANAVSNEELLKAPFDVELTIQLSNKHTGTCMIEVHPEWSVSQQPRLCYNVPCHTANGLQTALLRSCSEHVRAREPILQLQLHLL